MEDREQGIVRWYRADKGFGYISRDEESDVYVREISIVNIPKILHEGQNVEFTLGIGEKGPEAFDVIITD